MEEFNQIQNPNVPSDMPLSNSVQTPSVSPMPVKKRSPLFLIIVLVLIVIGVISWWYINQMSVDESAVLDQPKINQEAREDIQINQELGGVDTNNLDAEFNSIDADLNSL